MFSRDSVGIIAGNYSVDDYSLCLNYRCDQFGLEMKSASAPRQHHSSMQCVQLAACSPGRIMPSITVKIEPFD
jgi:hypothetical protein